MFCLYQQVVQFNKSRPREQNLWCYGRDAECSCRDFYFVLTLV